jgi:ribonuclease HII
MANFAIERRFKEKGFDIIIGVDEAGRGPLAGPLVAAAVYLQSTRFKNHIDDSKKLNPKQRQNAFLEIAQKSIFGLSIVDEKKIDALNILVATRLCMQRAVSSLLKKVGDKRRPLCYEENLGSKKERGKRICIIVDGNMKFRVLDYPVFSIIKGDAKSKTIASASILAKVSRDWIMSLYDKVWPQYGFLRHKGYPTSLHRHKLKQLGPCPIHRLSFSYV